MASYTCISCRVAFADGELQRAHYKTDWHRYNLKRKVADMPPVTAENFQERVLAQRAATEQQLSDVAATEGCAVCNKKFSTANAYHNHLHSHKHQQAEKQALLVAQRKVEKMNEKNLEKGLCDEKADHDARNEALQQALKEQQRPTPAQQGKAMTSEAVSRQRVEKPPRMMWLEEQAKRRREEEGGGDEWEDIDADEDDDDEMEEEEETMDEDEGDLAALSDTQSAALPGSIPVTDCLFCSHHSKSLMKNVAHMTKVHSFFIPDVEFLVDLKGLIRYLGEKVGAGNVCLWCNEKGRSFYSTEAVQSHMTDKSHCKLFADGDAALEFADFYDFRSSYPDRKDGEDVDMDDEGLPDDKMLECDDETLELTLPSGARIGHRSLMRYYKQRFGTQRVVALSHNRNAVGRVLRQYKALGWGGEGGGGIPQKQRDMQYVQMMKSKWMLKMGMNNNATKQKHFRVQGDLLNPCRCDGSVRYTHQHCLLKWISERGCWTCELCCYRFHVVAINMKRPWQWQSITITLVEKVQIIAVFLGSLFLVASISWLLWSALSPQAIWQRRDVLFQICYGMYGFMDLVCVGLIIHEGAAVYSVFLRWRAVNLHWDVQSYDKAKDMEETSTGNSSLAPRTLWLPLVSFGFNGTLQPTQLGPQPWTCLCLGPFCRRLLPQNNPGQDGDSGEVVIRVTSV